MAQGCASATAAWQWKARLAVHLPGSHTHVAHLAVNFVTACRDPQSCLDICNGIWASCKLLRKAT